MRPRIYDDGRDGRQPTYGVGKLPAKPVELPPDYTANHVPHGAHTGLLCLAVTYRDGKPRQCRKNFRPGKHTCLQHQKLEAEIAAYMAVHDVGF
jgi:hypothetical protein